jgi:hypothetical protein
MSQAGGLIPQRVMRGPWGAQLALAARMPFPPLVVLGLGLVSVAMIGLARLLRRWREGADRGDPTSGP